MGVSWWNLQSQLLVAIQKDDVMRAKELLADGVDCDARFLFGSHRRPALCLCVERDSLDLGMFLFCNMWTGCNNGFLMDQFVCCSTGDVLWTNRIPEGKRHFIWRPVEDKLTSWNSFCGVKPASGLWTSRNELPCTGLPSTAAQIWLVSFCSIRRPSTLSIKTEGLRCCWPVRIRPARRQLSNCSTTAPTPGRWINWEIRLCI